MRWGLGRGRTGMGAPCRDDAVPAVLVLCEPLGGARPDALCAMLVELVTRTGADAACCDVRGLERPGLRAAGVLARLRLAADATGCTFVVLRAPQRFAELLRVLGLGTALPCAAADADGCDPFAPEAGSWWS